jgi:hypothetical protein
MKVLQAVEGREAFLGVIEAEDLSVYGVPARERLLRSGLHNAAFLRVGGVVRGACGEDVFFGNDEGRVAIGEIVEPATNGCLSRGDQSTAETFVVALASLEGPVDEDVEWGRFRSAL